MRKKAKQAQALGEYVVIITLAVAAVSTSTVLVKRALQARLKDANEYMLKTVSNAYQNSRTADEKTPEKLKIEYEPYYSQTNSIISRDTNDTVTYLPFTVASGISTTIYNETTAVNSVSIQAPPKESD